MKTSNMIKSTAVLLFVLGGVQVAFAGADAVVYYPVAGDSADGVNGLYHVQTKDLSPASTGGLEGYSRQ